MSYVVNKDGTYKEVKNLRWLLDHSDQVESFKVEGGRTRFVALDEMVNNTHWEIPEKPHPLLMDSVMIANLYDGRKYVTRWASYEVMLEWLHRPKFKGCVITWFGLRTRIPID